MDRDVDIEKPRIIFVLPVLGQPRHSKRVEMVRETGFEPSVASFSRKYHEGRMPDCRVLVLGTVEHGRYFSRIPKLLKAIWLLRRALKSVDVIFAAGADMAFISILANWMIGKPICFEMGDIRRIQIANSFRGWLTRQLDSWIIRRCGLLVVTTKNLVENYYSARSSKALNFVVVENKLEKGGIKNNDPPLAANCVDEASETTLTIGYFGLIRCSWSISMLEELAKQLEHLRIIIAGHSILDFDLADRIKEYRNIQFLGAYKSPVDLPELYNRIDLTWACYPAPEVDEQWRKAQAICRSNRFYEGCYFKTPIISLADSADGKEVKRLRIGPVFESHSSESIVEKMKSIDSAEIDAWKEKMNSLPRSIYELSDEPEKLSAAIKKLLL